MNERRFPLGLVVMVPVIAGFAVYAFTTQQEPVVDPETAAANATATVDSLIRTAQVGGAGATPTPADGGMQTAIAADQTAMAALTPMLGTPVDYVPPSPPQTDVYATPTAVVRGQFREGAIARVNVGAGDCLNVRNRPGTGDEYGIINTCLPDGFEGLLVQGAEGWDATANATGGAPDGRWWWLMAGHGWVAEEYLVYVRDEPLTGATAPHLAGKGRIAYVRENDVWLMDADGGNQRTLIPNADQSEYPPRPQDLSWSPDGRMLSYNIWRPGDDGQSQTADLHIVQLTDAGAVAAESTYPNTLGANWSPDSARIGIIRTTNIDSMGGGYKGLPGVLDLTAGERLFGTEEFWQTAPPAFNYDGTLLLVRYANYELDLPSAILVWDLEGREVDRIEQPENGGFSSPRWSPTANRIAMHESVSLDGGTTWEPYYTVLDVATGTFVVRVPVPDSSAKAGGRCGGIDMWRMEWTRDGSGIMYSFDMGDNGANGIWAWDIASGQQKLIPAFGASTASAGPDGWFAFTVWGGQEPYILVANEEGGYGQPLAKGYFPAWWAPR